MGDVTNHACNDCGSTVLRNTVYACPRCGDVASRTIARLTEQRDELLAVLMAVRADSNYGAIDGYLMEDVDAVLAKHKGEPR